MSSSKQPPVATPATPARRVRTIGGAGLAVERSREAKQRAAAILEVLAGARSPSEAATALAISVPHYYQVETRALHGLLAACEAPPRGRVRNPHSEVTALHRDIDRLQREVIRQQALVRAAQRTVGLSPPPTPAPGKATNKKVRKRKVARALSVAARLQQTPDGVAEAALSSSLLDGEDKS